MPVRVLNVFLLIFLVSYSLLSEEDCAPQETQLSSVKQYATELNGAFRDKAKIDKALNLWDKYVKSIPYKLQKGCEPMYLPPAETARPIKGTVMLYHGFTACPKQFQALANKLSAQGYHVFVPTLPGNGRDFNDGPEHEFLPKKHEWRKYEKFALQMNNIAKAGPGERVVGGLSVGGAVAAMSAIEGQDIYDRAMIMAPFLSLPNTYAEKITTKASANKSLKGRLNGLKGRAGNFIKNIPTHSARAVAEVLKRVPGVGNIDYGWGEGCYDAGKKGRAGICSFKVEHLFAADSFGMEVMKRLNKKKPLKVSMQVVAVEKDPAANTSPTRELMFEAMRSKLSSVCFLDKSIPHAFLTKEENLGRDTYWLPDVNRCLTNFMANEMHIKRGPPSKEEVGFDKCDIKGYPIP